MSNQQQFNFRNRPMIDEIKAWESRHTSGRARDIKRLELLIANFNGEVERAIKARRWFVIAEQRNNAGMAELVDAPHLQGTKSFAVHAVKWSSITHEPEGFDIAGSNPAPRTNSERRSGLMDGLRRGETRYRQEGALYPEAQANAVTLHSLYGANGEQAPSGPRAGSGIKAAGIESCQPIT